MRFIPLALALSIIVAFLTWVFWIDRTEARASHALDYTIELVECDTTDKPCSNIRMTVANKTKQSVIVNYNDTGGGPGGGKNNIKIYDSDGKSCEGRPYWTERSPERSGADEIPAGATYHAYLYCEFYKNSSTERPEITDPAYATIYGKRYDIR